MIETTVIIALYNKKRYVLDSIRSALALDDVDEVLVVDDGSTDGSGDLVQQIGDPRVRVIRQANAGPGAARNRGLSECRGKYVVFLDADDKMFDGFVSSAKPILDQNPNCAAVAHAWLKGSSVAVDMQRYNLCGITPGPYRLPTSIAGREFRNVIGLCAVGSMLMRTSVVKEFGGFYSKNRCTFGEDIFLWIQVLLKYPVWFTIEPRMWWNTEGSELSANRKGQRPREPILANADAIVETTSPEYRDTLIRLLELYAAIEAGYAIRYGRSEHARALLERFPGMERDYPEEFRDLQRMLRYRWWYKGRWHARQFAKRLLTSVGLLNRGSPAPAGSGMPGPSDGVAQVPGGIKSRGDSRAPQSVPSPVDSDSAGRRHESMASEAQR